MRILFCCEFYAPSIGGVQEVMRQVAERLVQSGHQVTVATSKLSGRHFESLNGVQIKEFAVSGNLVRGIFGDEESYRNYVVDGDFEVVMIKAAQQWTFDALWPVLESIKIPKVFIPCGFSEEGERSGIENYWLGRRSWKLIVVGIYMRCCAREPSTNNHQLSTFVEDIGLEPITSNMPCLRSTR